MTEKKQNTKSSAAEQSDLGSDRVSKRLDQLKKRNEQIKKRQQAIEKKGKIIAERSKIYYDGFNTQDNAEQKNDEPRPECACAENIPTAATECATNYEVRSSQEPKHPKRHGMAMSIIATVLSSISILLLIALTLSLSFGIIPLPNSNSNSGIQISDGNNSSDNSQVPDSEAENHSNMLESFMDSVVIVDAALSNGTSMGTGIVTTSDGYIVTNYHVVDDAKEISVRFYGETKPVSAKLVGYKEIDDIAVLKVDRKDLKAAVYAKSSECKVGERVYAVGTPEGDEFGWSVTQGIISSADREIKLYDNEGILEKKMKVIQTDASVNPGNSGGPLINSKGEVVGIITLKLSDSAGMGFAIPSDGALEIINAIITTGSADNVVSSVTSGRPLIGITGVGVEGGLWYENFTEGATSGVRVVEESYAKENPDNTFYAAVSGVHVSATTKGLDAANKLKANDIITEVNGIKVTNIYQVMDVINRLNGGDVVSVTYYRDGSYATVDITLGTASN
jgi:serine protease Do